MMKLYSYSDLKIVSERGFKKAGYITLLFFTSIIAIIATLPTVASAKCIEGNCINGKGVYLYSHGEKYTGDFKEGHREGFGTLIFPNGDTYEGEFVDGDQNGLGKYHYANGDTYIGQLKNGLRNGYGVYTFADGEKFEGEFVDDKPVKNGTTGASASTLGPGRLKPEADDTGDKDFSEGVPVIPPGSPTREGSIPENSIPDSPTPEGLTPGSSIPESQASKDAGFKENQAETIPTEEVKDTSVFQEQGENSTTSLEAEKDTTPPEIFGVTVDGQPIDDNEITVKSEKVAITGNVSDVYGVSIVYVNGVEAKLDKEGKFSAYALLKAGKNRIVISATDIHKNRAEKVIKLTMDESSKVQVSTSERPVSATEMPVSTINIESNTVSIPKGRFVALVIGISKYKNFDPLPTAAGDADVVASTLRDHYGFEVKTLIDENATRYNIMEELIKMRETLALQDSLLVYYAGRGHYERVVDKAYWIPYNAEKTTSVNWIIADEITTQLKLTPARHVLIVADSCYSGTALKGSTILSAGERTNNEESRNEHLGSRMSKVGRIFMGSGTYEPVSSPPGDHSAFARAFVDGLLNANEKVFTAEEFFIRHIIQEIPDRSGKLPVYRSILNSGDDGGDFIFVKVR